MVYPKLNRKESKRCKLSDSQISKICKLYAKGKSVSFLSGKFKVSEGTIKYWAYGEDYRKNSALRVYKCQLKRWELHPEEKEIYKSLHTRAKKDLYSRSKPLREYRKELQKLKRQKNAKNKSKHIKSSTWC